MFDRELDRNLKKRVAREKIKRESVIDDYVDCAMFHCSWSSVYEL